MVDVIKFNGKNAAGCPLKNNKNKIEATLEMEPIQQERPENTDHKKSLQGSLERKAKIIEDGITGDPHIFDRPYDKFPSQFITLDSMCQEETLEQKLEFLDRPLLTKNQKKLQ